MVDSDPDMAVRVVSLRFTTCLESRRQQARKWGGFPSEKNKLAGDLPMCGPSSLPLRLSAHPHPTHSCVTTGRLRSSL